MMLMLMKTPVNPSKIPVTLRGRCNVCGLENSIPSRNTQLLTIKLVPHPPPTLLLETTRILYRFDFFFEKVLVTSTLFIGILVVE